MKGSVGERTAAGQVEHLLLFLLRHHRLSIRVLTGYSTRLRLAACRCIGGGNTDIQKKNTCPPQIVVWIQYSGPQQLHQSDRGWQTSQTDCLRNATSEEFQFRLGAFNREIVFLNLPKDSCIRRGQMIIAEIAKWFGIRKQTFIK